MFHMLSKPSCRFCSRPDRVCLRIWLQKLFPCGGAQARSDGNKGALFGRRTNPRISHLPQYGFRYGCMLQRRDWRGYERSSGVSCRSTNRGLDSKKHQEIRRQVHSQYAKKKRNCQKWCSQKTRLRRCVHHCKPGRTFPQMESDALEIPLINRPAKPRFLRQAKCGFCRPAKPGFDFRPPAQF